MREPEILQRERAVSRASAGKRGKVGMGKSGRMEMTVVNRRGERERGSWGKRESRMEEEDGMDGRGDPWRGRGGGAVILRRRQRLGDGGVAKVSRDRGKGRRRPQQRARRRHVVVRWRRRQRRRR